VLLVQSGRGRQCEKDTEKTKGMKGEEKREKEKDTEKIKGMKGEEKRKRRKILKK
jgi:hypothetical protein